ncbi:MAG TPA: tetratricopeptide repeat protein [Chthonomonadaceae bacterium]|nr:tetratricopeptide repeat protein [Chthonomonadaceae bacterium]
MARPVLAVVGLAAVVLLVWLYGTSRGREWRLERTGTADLLAETLSHPEDALAQRILGRRLLAEGKAEEAASAFAREAAAQPGAIDPLVAQGRALLQAGRPVEALTPLEAALPQAPKSAEALAALGEVHYALGNSAQAEQAFRTAIQASPSSAAAYAGLAFVLADRYNYEAARQAATKAVQLAPGSGQAYLARGYVEDQAGNSAGAVQAYTRALQLEPDDGRAWELMAGVRTRIARQPQEFARAEEALARAERLRPQSPLIPYYRGLLLSNQHKYSQAIPEFRRALDRSPELTDALYHLSVALAFAGQPAESARARARFERLRNYHREMETLQILLGRDPNSVALWRKMEQLALAQGDEAHLRLARQKLQALATK